MSAGIEQVSFSLLPPLTKDYYTEYPVQFSFRVGYHTLGQFCSLVSGYDKIINLSELHLQRETGNPLYPATASFKVSAFVYKPAPVNPAPASGAAAPRPGAPGAPAKKDQGD